MNNCRWHPRKTRETAAAGGWTSLIDFGNVSITRGVLCGREVRAEGPALAYILPAPELFTFTYSTQCEADSPCTFQNLKRPSSALTHAFPVCSV